VPKIRPKRRTSRRGGIHPNFWLRGIGAMIYGQLDRDAERATRHPVEWAAWSTATSESVVRCLITLTASTGPLYRPEFEAVLIAPCDDIKRNHTRPSALSTQFSIKPAGEKYQPCSRTDRALRAGTWRLDMVFAQTRPDGDAASGSQHVVMARAVAGTICTQFLSRRGKPSV